MIRRVVTGHRNGRSVVVADGTPAHSHVYRHAVGMEHAYVWTTPPEPELSAADKAESWNQDTPIIPRLGGTSFLILTVPPESASSGSDYDPEAALQEMLEQSPDVIATHEHDNPGFHRTDSIDYVIVLDGEIHLELDDQQEVLLKRHDVLIGGGTRHAWKNKSNEPAVLAIVLVGATRDSR